MRLQRIALFCLAVLLAAACGTRQPEVSIEVTLLVDGGMRERVLSQELTVDQLLTLEGIELSPRDRLSHPLVSPVTNGMTLTVRRVEEKRECARREVAFDRLRLPKESLREGEEQLGQVGAAGIEEACYAVIMEDDVEAERQLIGEPAIIQPPTDEITWYGIPQSVAPIAIAGRLGYINHGEAWTITGDASQKRRLTANLKLDALVFDQSADGSRLLFTAKSEAGSDFFNSLWMLETDGESTPTRLTPSDVLFAEWRPQTRAEIAYSTGLRKDGADITALNNLWLLRIDLQTGRAISVSEAFPESPAGGTTRFAWSPDGAKMAWARTDGIGIVDMDEGLLQPLLTYAPFDSGARWTWQTSLSWSFDSRLLGSAAHGAPIGDEPATASPVFNLAVVSADGGFAAQLQRNAGMWAAPGFSPASANGEGYIAWLSARQPQNSLSSQYDLMIADRDGSNESRIFPPVGETGINRGDFASTAPPFAWSPDARQIAIVYRGDIWLVDVADATATQVTFDGASSFPVWSG